MPGTTAPDDTATTSVDTGNGQTAPDEQAISTNGATNGNGTAPTPAPDDTAPQTDGKTARELELEAELEAERQKKDKAYRDARKQADARRKTQANAGEFEALYTESQAELATVASERDAVIAERDTARAELKAARKELEDYRVSMVERFESEEDKAIATSTSLDKLPALHERLYQRPIMQPPPSVGIARTTTHATETAPQSLEEYNRKKYG